MQIYKDCLQNFSCFLIILCSYSMLIALSTWVSTVKYINDQNDTCGHILICMYLHLYLLKAYSIMHLMYLVVVFSICIKIFHSDIYVHIYVNIYVYVYTYNIVYIHFIISVNIKYICGIICSESSVAVSRFVALAKKICTKILRLACCIYTFMYVSMN